MRAARWRRRLAHEAPERHRRRRRRRRHHHHHHHHHHHRGLLGRRDRELWAAAHVGPEGIVGVWGRTEQELALRTGPVSPQSQARPSPPADWPPKDGCIGGWSRAAGGRPTRRRAQGRCLSARVSRRTTRVRIRPVMRDGQLEGRPSCPGFPLRFRRRRSLLGHPLPAEELGSPHGRLTGHPIASGPRRGYRFPHARAAAGVGASYTPRPAVLFPAEGRVRPAPAALPRLVLRPRSNIPIHAGLRVTRHRSEV